MRQRNWGAHHQEWHFVRRWDFRHAMAERADLPEADRQDIQAMVAEAVANGWTRAAIPEGTAGGGEEFLFMHRAMFHLLAAGPAAMKKTPRAGKAIAVGCCTPSGSRRIRPPQTYGRTTTRGLTSMSISTCFAFTDRSDRSRLRHLRGDVLHDDEHDDEEVFFEDAMVSVERLRNRGANISVRAYEGLDHINTWVHAMPHAVSDFTSLSR